MKPPTIAHLKMHLNSVLHYAIHAKESDLTFVQLVARASKRLDELEQANLTETEKAERLKQNDLFKDKWSF